MLNGLNITSGFKLKTTAALKTIMWVSFPICFVSGVLFATENINLKFHLEIIKNILYKTDTGDIQATVM